MTIIVLLWVGLPPSHAKINLMSRPSSSPFSIRRQSGEVERRRGCVSAPSLFLPAEQEERREEEGPSPLLTSPPSCHHLGEEDFAHFQTLNN